MSVARIAKKIRRAALLLHERYYFWRHPEHPWLVPEATRWLQQHLAQEKAAGRNKMAYEFGSGRSTYFFGPYFDRYLSVEHDSEWAGRVKEEIEKRNLRHVDLLLAPPKAEAKGEIRRNSLWEKLSYAARKPRFQAYFESVLDRCGTTPLDFALVDGRARVACFLNTLPLIRSGGVIVFDNFDRPEYHAILPLMTGWKDLSFRTGLFETRIFIAP